MVVGESDSHSGDYDSPSLAKDKIPARRTRIFEHLGIAISHHYGNGWKGFPDVIPGHVCIFIPCGLDSLLHERYSFSASIC